MRVTTDVTVAGSWTINGGVADATSCGAAGIQTVRLQVCEFVDGDCYTATNLQAACSAGTLSRYLAVLSASGCTVDTLIPYDFFPQTHHVETLALLVRDG